MPDWREWVGIYIALLIGGVASMLTHFVGYIVVLLVALGYIGFVAYHEQKGLAEHQEKDLTQSPRPR